MNKGMCGVAAWQLGMRPTQCSGYRNWALIDMICVGFRIIHSNQERLYQACLMRAFVTRRVGKYYCVVVLVPPCHRHKACGRAFVSCASSVIRVLAQLLEIIITFGKCGWHRFKRA